MAVEMIALRIAREIREEQAHLAQHMLPTQPNKRKNAPMSQKTEPKTEKSKIVQMALLLFALALVGALIATAVPVVAPLAIVVALTGVGLTVLSLREL